LKNVEVRQVPWKMRPYDDPIYIGDNSKLRRLGWEPKIPMEKTLADMLEYWRERL
jgi:GDP-4-dehydro-6-deoxy-D-mannose reductase